MRTNASVLTCVALLMSCGVAAQAPEGFEVASIRRHVSSNQQGGGLSAPQPGGRFVALGVTLRRLVADAYEGVDVVGGPAWIGTDRFDVNARAEGERSPVEIRHMLRPLLAERFGHYFPSAQPGPPACGDFRLGGRMLTARGMTMAGLAGVLSGRTGRTVFDRTGLVSAYDLEIEWSSDVGLSPAPPGAAGAHELSLDGVSLFTALQEQIGLRLRAARGSVDVIVIDRAEPLVPD